MRLGRKKTPVSVRQRRRNDDPKVPVNKTFSYRSRRSSAELNTGRQLSRDELKAAAATKGKYWLQRLGLIALMVAVVASTINALTLSDQSKVIPLKVEGSTSLMRPIKDYEQATNKILAKSIWNQNKITINTSEVSQQLVAQFPELASASVTVPLLAHRPVVHIEPATPALILVGRNGSFLVTNTGKAVLMASTPEQLNQPDLIRVTDQSGLHLRLNKQALPAGQVTFIQSLITQLAAKQFSVSGMILPPAASQLDVTLVGQPYTVKFNLQNLDSRAQAGTFLATIKHLQQQNTIPAKYVDVRVDGRAYYQ